MNPSKMAIPAPPSVDIAALSDPKLTVRATGPLGEVLLHYNPQRLLSAVVHLINGTEPLWTINAPVSLETFLATLTSRGIHCEHEALTEWAAHCRSKSGMPQRDHPSDPSRNH